MASSVPNEANFSFFAMKYAIHFTKKPQARRFQASGGPEGGYPRASRQ
ncbi:hypothetical protein ACU62J_18500 [Klebsiella aerogenes]